MPLPLTVSCFSKIQKRKRAVNRGFVSFFDYCNTYCRIDISDTECCALSVRCRAYSGLESGQLENKTDEHELGDDDDVVDSNSKLKFVRTSLLHSVVFIYLCVLLSSSSMHHYECVAPCKDISLHRGRFCTRCLASCIPRSSEDRSSWMFFIQVVHGRPDGRL